MSFRLLEWANRPDPNEPALLRNCERFTDSTRDFCAIGLFSELEIGSVTVLEPPDNRRTLLVDEISPSPALSDTLLFRLFAA